MKYFFLIIFILLYLGANFYVFYRAWFAMPLASSYGKAIFIIFASVVVLSFFVFSFVGEYLPIPVSSILYKIGSSWFIILSYLLIFTFFMDLLRVTRLMSPNMMSLYTKENWMIFSLVVAFLLLLLTSGYLKYRSTAKVELALTVDKKTSLDKPLRIVALSDVHLGYGIDQNELQKWVGLINKENPDIVLISGDIIDNSVRPLRAAKMEKYLAEIKAKYGVYAVMGNHEYISGSEASQKFIEDAGIRLLKDEAVLVDSAFFVVGRDDRSNKKRKSLNELIAPIDKSKPIILLDHQPYDLDEAQSNGIDFQFSGHTHHGQVWPISVITDWIYEKSYGYLKKGDTSIYVTSGIGLWGGKFRIGTQSEYVIIELNTK